MHSTVRPDSLSSRAPNSGALVPKVARHCISPFRSKRTAAPVAPVARHACSTISLSTTCNASSADISADTLPPPCAANLAASSATLDSRRGAASEPGTSPTHVTGALPADDSAVEGSSRRGKDVVTYEHRCFRQRDLRTKTLEI